MNIGISTLVSSDTLEGVGKYMLFLIEHLQKLKTDHRFYIFVNRDFDELISIENPQFEKVIVDIPHHPRLFMRPLYFIWQNFLAHKLYQKYQIDLVHIPNPIPFLNSGKIPHIFTIHDAAEFRVKRYTYLRQQFRKFALNSSARKSAHILTVSNYSKQDISETLQLPEDKIDVATLACSLKLKAEIPVTDFKNYLLHIGGSKLNKNADRVIKAFIKLNKSKDLKLILVGSNKQSSRSITDSENIEWIGYVSDQELFSLYKNARALIYPSTYEGFGLPILEAMASGTPVITSNVTSMPEVGGDAAHYVDPFDTESIRQGMEKVLNDEKYRQELIEKGLKRYKEFDWMETARKTVEVYEKAVGNEQ